MNAFELPSAGVNSISTIKLLVAIVAGAALAACGGGGSAGDNPYSRTTGSDWGRSADINSSSGGNSNSSGSPEQAPAEVNTAEGFWSGPASTGFNVSLAVLENGEAWGVYSAGNGIFGALQGSARGEGVTLTASGTDYNFQTDSATSATVTGTVNQKGNIEGRTSLGTTMSLKYSAAYDQPASLAKLAGQYAISGRTFDGYFGVNQLTISPSGAFTLVDGGCTATGNLAARSSGKNVFNLNVSFSGTCLVSGSVTGVAYLETASSPMQFVALALKNDKRDGLIVVGAKR